MVLHDVSGIHNAEKDAPLFLFSCLVMALSLYLHYSGFWKRLDAPNVQMAKHALQQDDKLGASQPPTGSPSTPSTPGTPSTPSRKSVSFMPVAMPVHAGVAFQSNIRLDCLSLCRYMPENTYVITPKAKTDEPQSSLDPGAQDVTGRSSGSHREEPDVLASAESSMPPISDARESKSTSHKQHRPTLSRASLRQSLSWAQQAYQNKTKAEALTISKLPMLPGCELDGKAAKKMQALFPDASLADIVRFLVARKGEVQAAAEMMTKANEWHRTNFPLSGDKLRQVDAALSAGCFFTHGKARDGTPVLYMRGALYDGSKASPEAYVLAAAHAIIHALSHSTELNVTVLVHAVNVPGAPNDNADLTFIKGFISVLSDNFPERLKRLAIFPFPWYGRAIWSILKVFVDKRTQNKVMLLSGDGTSIPPVGCGFLPSPYAHLAHTPSSNLPLLSYHHPTGA